MAITWVQGTTAQASEGGPSTPITVTLMGVTAGNCLIVSVGRRTNLSTAHGLMYLTDDRNNKWLAPTTSPAQSDGGSADYQLCTFVAVNCAGGDTAITISETQHFGAYAISVDEYSGVGAAFPVDQVSFGATAVGSGLTSIASGSITAASGQLVYSAAYGMASPLTLTPTAGFIQREVVTGTNAYPITLYSWDQQSSGGSYSNTVSAGANPGTLHVNLIGLSPTTLTRILVQSAAYCIAAVSSTTVSATFPYNNSTGNLLIAVGLMVERTDATITDTQGNTWVVVYSDPSSLNDTIVMAYCLSCKPGPNTVTMTALGGGNDDHLMLIIEELNVGTPVSYITSNKNALMYGSSINTGNVAGQALLVSMFSGNAINGLGLSAPGPVSQLENMRYQFSDSGFFEEGIHVLGVADLVVGGPGTYSNTFTISPASATLSAAILSFAYVITLQCASGTAQLGVPYNSALVAAGGTLPYTFAIIAGSLPPGLTLNAITGVISGVPSAQGIYPYTAQVTDANDLTATASCSITVSNLPMTSVSTCGKLNNYELTRDLDADWDDRTTFFITHSDPLPFTVRGLVLRISYNMD